MSISLSLWKSIITFAEDIKGNNDTTGIMICGSLANNTFMVGSDIDILFLVKSDIFLMETINKDNLIFDKLITSYDLLKDILSSNCFLSDVLSLSIGSHQIVIDETTQITELILIAKQNIQNKKLVYSRPENKEPHSIGDRYTLVKYSGGYDLVKEALPNN